MQNSLHETGSKIPISVRERTAAVECVEGASLNSDARAGAGGDGMGSEDVCLMGEADGFLGDDMIMATDEVSPASQCFEVRRMLSKTRRACSLRLQIFVTVSLLLWDVDGRRQKQWVWRTLGYKLPGQRERVWV
jgi:hypothetical protein